MKIGSLFSGYGGLDMGVQAVLGGETAWFVEYDDAPSRILAQHWPDVPNHGDITTVDWEAVEPVDILTGGFPCQDLSLAGRRAGMRPGTRSGLWNDYLRAIDVLRPRLAVIENVRGLLSGCAESDLEPCPGCMGDGEHRPVLRALGRVLGDLAELGYDAEWLGLRAADAGAPHGRFRVFILAHPQGAGRAGGRIRGGLEEDELVLNVEPAYAGDDIADPQGQPWGVGHGDDVRAGRGADGRDSTAGRGVVEDTDLAARGERWEPAPGQAEGGRAWADAGGRGGASATDPQYTAGRGNSGESSTEEARSGSSDGSRPGTRVRTSADWGPYRPAIERWELVTGRNAPAPTRPDGRDGGHRLNPEFVEWMMGLPAGHVTAVGLNREQQLKALGNGVVPQQAALALSVLLSHSVGTETLDTVGTPGLE